MANHYDYILAGIPALMGGGGALYLAGIDLGTGVITGATAAVLLIGYGMFIDPPKNPIYGPHQ